jgi:hypothetical protein
MTSSEHTYDRDLRRALGLEEGAAADQVLAALGRINTAGFRLVHNDLAVGETLASFREGAEAAAFNARRFADATAAMDDEALAPVLGRRMRSAFIEWENPE